jgi:DUF917 family protein
MATRKLESKEAILDFVRGCTFYGTGGGGTPEEGIRELEKVLDSGKVIQWTDVSDIPNEGYSVCPFLMGSIAPWTEETKKEMKEFGLGKQSNDNLLVKSTELLGKFTSKEPKVIVPSELGGANTPVAVAAAMELGITVVDGDIAGRAVPEIPQTTPFLHDKSLLPMSSIDGWGEICYIEKTVNPLMAERIGKFISAAAYGLVGQAGFLMPVSEMKEVIIPGTLTECFEAGELIRIERESGRNPVEALVKKVKGKVLFKGKVSKKSWEDKDGYYWGTHDIAGEDEFAGSTFRIWFKNENHISWLNGNAYVTSPDILTVVRTEDAEPLANPAIEEGMNVTVIGVPARPQFLTEKGIEILGPKHFGFDIEYKDFSSVVEE